MGSNTGVAVDGCGDWSQRLRPDRSSSRSHFERSWCVARPGR